MDNQSMFERAGDILSGISPRKLAIYLFLIMLVRTGLWTMGSFAEQLMVVIDPFAVHYQSIDQHYIFWNYLGPFVANLIFMFLPLTSVPAIHDAFFVYSLCLTLLGTLLFCHLAITRLEAPHARAALLLYFIMPISATAYFWVGMDGLTQLLLLLPFVYPRLAPWGAFIGVFLGLQHFEQGFVAYGALLLSLLLAKTHPFVTRKWAAAVLGGVIAGKIILIGWFASLHLELHSDRVEWYSRHAQKVISYALMHPHITYVSLFGIGWIAIFAFAGLKEWRRAFFIPLASFMALPFLIEDETRVVALVSLPLLTAWMFLFPDYLKKLDRSMLGMLAIAYVLVPWLWTWRGEPRWSAFPYDLGYLSATFFGWPDLPQDMFRWLFHWQ